MKVLITGNMGYVGPVLVRHLRREHPDWTLIGFDQGYFAHCLTNTASFPESKVNIQHFGDVRNFPVELLDGVDAVVHLAAVSNDPMGKRFEIVTDEINHLASIRIAEACRDRGVKNYVFASSCSMYGSASGDARKETDSLNPLTAYARSKVATEEGLVQMAPGNMVITALRFATACGASDRLRLDLVLNDFVACAIAAREITVLSDGTPWRPLIEVRDMARAIEWACQRDETNGGQIVRVNAGSDEWNYQVKDLAGAVADTIPGIQVSINKEAPPDKRSYRVDFSLFKELAPAYLPQIGLEEAIEGVAARLKSLDFKNAAFRESQFMRLKVLESHINEGRLDDGLIWQAV